MTCPRCGTRRSQGVRLSQCKKSPAEARLEFRPNEAVRREAPMIWESYPNLAKRPHAPAKGRGRLQRQVRRALIVHGPLVTTSQLLNWAYPRNRRRPTGWDHSKVMRICAEHCDRVRRVPPHGTWLWRLRNSGDDD